MKKIFSVSLVALTLFFGLGLDIHVAEARGSAVHVKGYYRNGTYVVPHYRSAPDGSVGHNWSTIGNVNPYTGKAGTQNPLNTPTYITPSYQPSVIPAYTPVPFLLPTSSASAAANITQTGLPAHANAAYFGDWTCERGYSKNFTKNTCDPVFVPQNGTLDYFGNGWICNRGYVKNYNRGTCDAVIILAHARLDYFGSDYICDRGFFKNIYNGTCDTVVVPINAHLDYFGSNWECDRGYSKNIYKATCEKVIVPLHAGLNYFGNGWECENGYYRQYFGNTCEPLQ